MSVFQLLYSDVDLLLSYPNVSEFFNTTAKGKSDAILTAFELILASYKKAGFGIPSSKAEMKVFESFVKNSTLILNSHFDILCGTTPHPIISNNAVELKSVKSKKFHNQLKSEASTLPVKKEVKKEAKAAKPKSNSDFEMFNYSKDEKLKTPSSVPASTLPLKKEAKEKPMTTQQPKAEAKNGKDDYMTFEPDMAYFTPPEDKEADDVPRKPILGKRSPII